MIMNNRRIITASRLLPLEGDLPEDPVLVFEDDQIVEILSQDQVADGLIEKYNGTLIPGFVNAHCHLELSHMKGIIEPGTGLTKFLQGVVTQPPVPVEVVNEAIVRADQEMWEAGIVAVGDISNKAVTAAVKVTSPIAYYTFVEMFDFFKPEHATRFFEQYNEVYKIFREMGLKDVSRVPHSPYTVSRELEKLLAPAVTPDMVGSIHMLENEQETKLLTGEDSEYFHFFAEVGFALDDFVAPNHGSMEKFLQSGYHPSRMLFVHNTVAGDGDLKLMEEYAKVGQPYLVTCPNANLYIESRLPDYTTWLESNIPVCIGTDSYSSNHQLSIWKEICTIKSHLDEVSWEELIRWGSLHGAQALNMSDRLGSFEVGKSPGAVLLEYDEPGQINVDTTVRRIV